MQRIELRDAGKSEWVQALGEARKLDRLKTPVLREVILVQCRRPQAPFFYDSPDPFLPANTV